MTLKTMTTLSAPMMPMTSMMAMILCQCTTSVRSTTQWAEVTTEPLQTNIYSKHPYEYINISTQLSSIVPAFVYYRLHWQQLSKFDNREKKNIYIKKKKNKKTKNNTSECSNQRHTMNASNFSNANLCNITQNYKIWRIDYKLKLCKKSELKPKKKKKKTEEREEILLQLKISNKSQIKYKKFRTRIFNIPIYI